MDEFAQIQQLFAQHRKKITAALLFAVIAVGLFLRGWGITESNFFLFDEGFYLNYNLRLLRMVDHYHFSGFKEFMEAYYGLVRCSLVTGKALWFFIVDSRAFWGWLHQWWYPRVVSMTAGLLTLVMVYQLAKRLYDSQRIAFLSVAILSVYPSHIFYSRLAFQEALCTFFFAAGIYFYIKQREFGWPTIISGLLFGCVYFTNYRLIIAPCLVGFVELYMSVALRGKPQIRKYVWHTLIFAFLVIMIGNMDHGSNTYTTFSWMFYQANMAHGTFEWLNMLSYPYYLFRLDTFFVGTFFFANIYFLWQKEWMKALPFLLVVVMMAIFSLPYEKGARYICIGLPFVAIAISALIVNLADRKAKTAVNIGLGVAVVLLFTMMTQKSIAIASARSDYERSMQFVLKLDPQAKIISTQPYVQKLYAGPANQVSSFSPDFAKMLESYARGTRFLIIDPQAYVSYTANEKRFDPELINYAEFIVNRMKPLKTFPHFTDVILERFVFEHNENLRQSIKFLSIKDKQFGALRVYEIGRCLEAIARLSNRE